MWQKAKIMKFLYKLQDEHLKTSKKARINIFLTPEEYKKLNEIKQKYHLSFSTIVSIITQEYNCYRVLQDLAAKGRMLKQEKGNRKTSIKPITYNFEELKTNAVYYENMIHIFCSDSIKNYLPEKITNKIKNNIYNRFDITQDPLYDYNEFIRKAWVYDKYKRKAEL